MPVPSTLLVNGNEIPEYTMVMVLNRGADPVVFRWGKARYAVNPGQQIPVPYYAMTRECGDPRTVNVPGDRRRAYRTQEFLRLCTKYGVYDAHHLFDEKTPKIEVTTLTGERIYTVLDDPNGDRDNVELQNEIERTTLEDAVRVMGAQMKAMEAELAAVRAGAGSAVTPPADDTDTDTGTGIEPEPGPEAKLDTDAPQPAAKPPAKAPRPERPVARTGDTPPADSPQRRTRKAS